MHTIRDTILLAKEIEELSKTSTAVNQMSKCSACMSGKAQLRIRPLSREHVGFAGERALQCIHMDIFCHQLHL